MRCSIADCSIEQCARGMCKKHYLRAYRKLNKVSLNNKQAIKYKLIKDNPEVKEKRRIYSRNYRRVNKEILREKNKDYYRRNASQIKKIAKGYKQSEHGKSVSKAYRQRPEVKAKCNHYWKTYKRSKNKSDKGFNIMNRLRSRVRSAVRDADTHKASKTAALVGCSVLELKTHLESTFTKDMSWDRLRELHIDHIKPCCSFDLSKIEEQRKCFHYSNLRMLWAEDNLKKTWEDRRRSICA